MKTVPMSEAGCGQFLHCCHSSRCAPLFSGDIHTEIFAEGIWDKIFDTETIATLGRALGDEDHYVRRSVVKIFTAAIAQGVLHCFHRIFILKYLQRAFRDKIFDTETVTALGRALGDDDDLTSEAVQSISSLLP
jgi:hypothetical protein